MSQVTSGAAAPGAVKPVLRRKALAASDATPAPGAGLKFDEHFIPLTRFALMERLSAPGVWPASDQADAERFFRYLEFWRVQRHSVELSELSELYEPFSPDSDLFQTREFAPGERTLMKAKILEGMHSLLTQANYVRVDTSRLELIMTKDSYYGLDLAVDFDVFEELEIYFRGASVKREERRVLSRFFRKQEFEVPIFRRVFLLFKLKSRDTLIEEMMSKHGLDRREAEGRVKKRLAGLPHQIKPDNIYMKLFKNMPRTDMEMIFPNTQVRFRAFDKIKLGVTSGGAVGMGVFGTATKVLAGGAAALNPAALGGAMLALGGVAFRQGMAFLNQRQRYMVIMARNLYFHAMADNRGVLTKLAERAAEEDVKEELLLYCVLAKEPVHETKLAAVDTAIENWLADTFGLQIDFDVTDALSRLMNDGVVVRDADGMLRALPPRQALEHIDRLWDRVLDDLPPMRRTYGREVADPTLTQGKDRI